MRDGKPFGAMRGSVRAVVSAGLAVALLAGFLMVVPAPAPAAAGDTCTWEWRNPYPRGRNVLSVAAASATVSWAVGNSGQVYRYSGGTLTRQASPTDSDLYAVDALPGGNTTTAWAVGQAGTIIYTTNSGSTWTQQVSNTAYDLTGVAVIAANNVYAVGGYDGFTNAVILHYDGAAWSVQETYATGGFTDITAIDASHIWAVGQTPGIDTGHTLFSDGTGWVERDTDYAMISVDAYVSSGVYYLWGVTWDGTVIRSNNGGVSYQEVFNDWWPAGVTGLYSTSSPNHRVWVCGWDGTVRYFSGTWAGGTWSYQTSNTTTDLFDVDAYSTSGQFSVGYSNFLSNTGSTSWTVRSGSVATNNLNSCVSYGTDDVWAVGASGRIVKSANGGTTWATQTSGITYELRDIDAASENVLYAAGNNRTPRKTTNGGATWSATGNPTNTNWHGVAVADDQIVWIAGAVSGNVGAVNKTTNGGSNWTAQASNVGNNIIRAIDCVDSNNAMLVANGGRISTTSNGGTTWVARNSGTTGNLMAVSMVDADVAWAVGASGTILYTDSGGADWRAQASPTAQTLNGVAAVDATHAWAVSAAGEILYYDGSSWAVHTTPQPATTLNRVYAWDANNAWAVGATGAILFADPPYIKTCEPGYGDPGETVDVKIQGGYTHFQAGTPVPDFGAGVSMVPGSLEVADNTTLYARVQIDPGASPGPRSVNVITGTETPVPLSGGFTVGSEATISGASPSLKPRGWTGNVEVTGSRTSFDPSSRASFGGGVTVNSTTFKTPGKVIANVTIEKDAAPGPRRVNVITGPETPIPLSNGFTVATPPGIASVFPEEGPVGTTVTITGENFGATPYPGAGGPASVATFDGTPAGPVVEWSDTKVVCTVPEGARTGPVVVKTVDGESNTDRAFTVTAPGPAPLADWWLAEGSTAWGFETSINIENPNPEQVTARVTYYGTGGEGIIKTRDIDLPASSQTVVFANEDLGFETDFSTRVQCIEDRAIAVDRTMTWPYGTGGDFGAHNSIGLPYLSNRHYLPEGSSAWGFECWLCVQNPCAVDANVRLTYMTGDGPAAFDKVVPALSRSTFNMADDIGYQDASIQVTSDVVVNPERSMYRHWTPPDPGPEIAYLREGHCSVGALAPARDYYLAEGTTAWGFTTYVLVQNPGAVDTNVTLTYMTPDGPVVQPPFVLSAGSRHTVRVNDVLPDSDVSTLVHADKPIVAERAMYWEPVPGRGQAMHDSIGVAAPHAGWYLPAGAATALGDGVETYTLVQNPGGRPVDITVTYLEEGGGTDSFTDTVPAGSRRTYNMADRLEGDRRSASIMVRCTTPGGGVIVERSMYYGSRWSGTDTIGASSD